LSSALSVCLSVYITAFINLIWEQLNPNVICVWVGPCSGGCVSVQFYTVSLWTGIGNPQARPWSGQTTSSITRCHCLGSNTKQINVNNAHAALASRGGFTDVCTFWSVVNQHQVTLKRYHSATFNTMNTAMCLSYSATAH